MKILFLSHKIPYPPNKGDRIPTFHRMIFLSKRHDVSLAFPCFCKKELEYVNELKNNCVSVDTVFIRPFWAKLKSLFYLFSNKPLTLPYFYSRHLYKIIQKRIKKEKFDLIYIYSSSMAQYVQNIKGVKKIIDLADADSHKWLQYSKHTLPPLSIIYNLEYLRLKKYEAQLAKNFDHSVAISENEKELFGTYTSIANMSVISNGVDLDYFNTCNVQSNHTLQTANRAPQTENCIVFVGAMDYFANIDAVKYFCRETFPIISEAIPDIKFYIVGSNPVNAVKRLGNDKNVVVTGFVEDTRPYLKRCSVCVVPLRIARGVQNKILEAMAAGVPVITTSKGNEGINAKNGKEIFIEDEPQDFAIRVIDLIRNEQLRSKISREARRLVENRFNWQFSLHNLEEIFVQTCEK